MLEAIGRHVLQTLKRSGDMLGLLSLLISSRLSIAHSSRRLVFYKLYRLQIYYTGVQGFYVTAVISILIGSLLVFKLPEISPGEQTVSVFAELFVVVIIRELAPIMCALIAIVRSGTAVTAKIGYLKMSGEFDIAKTLGIDPVHLFLVPVFFAFPISMLLMLIYFLFFSMSAAFITLWLLDPGIGAALLIDNILTRVQLNEILVIVIKCVVSGLIIGLYALHYGSTIEARLTRVARGMSIATTRALVLVLFVNIIISILAYQ